MTKTNLQAVTGMNAIDLHVHSTYSDGTMSPAELIELAEELGLSAFALTDHDATMGLDEILALSAASPVEVVPGIEITSAVPGKDIHILGYYINYHHEEIQKFLKDLVAKREDRNRKMCERLHEAGLSITYEALRASVSPDTILTRMHFARFLLNTGEVSSLNEAFSRYLGDRCPTYVHREKVLPEDAVRTIRASGGVPVLAHPILYGFSDEKLERLISSLKDAGLAGIETVYSTYLPADERKIRSLAAKYNLIMTGGSDFHGSNKPHIQLGRGMGKLFIPEEFLDNVKKEYLKNYAPVNSSPCLLSFDMDGTLLNDEKKISPKTREALENALAKGHVFTISTGRPLKSIRLLADSLDLRKYNPLISAFNGGCIYDLENEKILCRDALPEDVALGIKEMIQKTGLHFHTYTENEVICERDTEEVKYYSNYVKMDYRVCDDVLKEEPCPFKFIIMHMTDRSVLEKLQGEILSKYGDAVQSIFSNEIFLEVIPKTSGKGIALRKMSEIKGIPFENSYAFADQDNDISMLLAAAHGVCLLNGSHGAKNAADYITFLDNNHDGLVPFLEALSRFL
ncbi:MAG: Cof-type HAD-IIB family hydrolase [Lachnospiraceae bacterium]|nr:Cof-type HAD-IIB family hydrolase [Lachnospiraceae bacterium]